MLTIPVVLAAVSLKGGTKSRSTSPPRVSSPLHPALSEMSLFSSQSATSNSVAAMSGSSSSTAPTTATSSAADISANGSSDAQSSVDVDNVEGGVSLFAAALDHLPHVRDANGDITTEGFCQLCELTLPCIGEDARTTWGGGGVKTWCVRSCDARARAPRVVRAVGP